MTHFYFIRHGQTDYNLAGNRKIDHPDHVPLNDTGRLQAQTIEPVIASLPIKTICCSPLLRAQETKEIITARLNAPIFDIDDLGECTATIWDHMRTKNRSNHVLTFHERVERGLNHVLSLEGPVLIVAHGGVHWAICSLLDIEERDHHWAIDNCVPVHFSLSSEGRWLARKL